MNQLAFSCFGTFQVRLGDGLLTSFRSAKTQGLLVYLLLTARRAHGRDALAALLWPDESEAIAKQNLRQSLYLLRKMLGDDRAGQQPFLQITRATVQFNPASDYRLDVTDFLAALAKGDLETAVAHYHGDLLPGFDCDSAPFDDWLRQERERLHRQALEALSKLATDRLASVDLQNARRFAQQQLALEPWREEAHRQLMQALAALGERTAALAQYETCRAVLAEELGVEPAAETSTLAHRIREANLQYPVQLPAERQRLTLPFVGRQAEYEALVRAYQQTTQGGLQVVTLQGQSGIGKTRLAEQFVTWAATQGADVLVGRSFATSVGLSYQPITHLLRERVERENAPDDLLSDLWLSQLSRLLPELRERYPDLPEPTQEENTARQHLFEAVTRLVHALAQRKPLVLFIDDWHWADSASLDLLHYAALRWAEAKAPILIVLTLRQEAIGESPELQTWLATLNRATDAVSLPLRELTQTDTTQLLQTLVAPETDALDAPLTQFGDWLFAETDGQPLFLTETLKALAEDGFVQPPQAGGAWRIDWARFDQQGASGRVAHGIQDIIQGWLARISSQAYGLLTAVSVLAQQASFDYLCRVAGLEEIEAIDALDDLLGKQLLQEAATAPNHEPIYSFSHQKVSDVVYAEAGTARRRLLHRRALATLQTVATPAADLAHHALHGGLPSETIHYSLLAGNEAMALFAVRVALTHYETAWQVTENKGWPETLSGADRQALYSGLGRTYELTESWPKAKETYQAMITYAQSLGAAAMECLGLNRLATVVLIFNEDQQQAIGLLEQARTIAEHHGDRRGLAETEWNLSLAARRKGELHLALHHAEQALAIARELDHPQLLSRCLTVLFYSYTMQRRWDKVEAYATEASQQATSVGNLVLAAESQRLVGFSQIYLGRPRASDTILQETLAFSQQIENLWGEAESARMLAQAKLELGHYGQAITLGRQAVKQVDTVGSPGLKHLAFVAWGSIQRTMMAIDDAKKVLLEVMAELTDQSSLSFTKSMALGELCALHAVAGEWNQAHDYARQIAQAQADKPLLSGALTGWYETEALLRAGDEDLARTEVERLAEIVGDNRRYRLILLRSQAVLAGWDGDIAQAIEHLEAALHLAHEIGLPGEAWPILGELGRLYGEQGAQQQARAAYVEAAAIAHRLADTIDDAALRKGFVTAISVQDILATSKAI